MKYTPTEYVALNIWNDDDGATSVQRRVVKTRKPQTCTAPLRSHDIPPGTMALCEKAIVPDEGRVSCYACTDCLDRMIDKEARYEATGMYA